MKFWLIFILLIPIVNAGIVEELKLLPDSISNSFFSFLKTELVDFISDLLKEIQLSMTFTIGLSSFFETWQFAVTIISLFYVINFLLIGITFLFSGYSSNFRNSAKTWFAGSIIGIILINASYVIYTFFLDLSNSIALAFWKQDFESLFLITNLSSFNLFWLIILSSGLFLSAISLVIRNILVVSGLVLFPLAIFLYFIPKLNFIGSSLAAISFISVFLQVLDTIILHSFYLLGSLSDLHIVYFTSTFFLIAAANFSAFFLAFLNSLRGIKNVL